MSWKNRLPWVLQLWVLAIVGLMTFAGLVGAQGVSELDIENDPEYQETQKLLASTQNIIAKARAETDARAKEIEALTNRVGELISNIGSTSEDASNLRSELSVVNDLLSIERQTTDELREEMVVLNQEIALKIKKKSDSEAKLQSTIASLHSGNTKVLKRLKELEAQENNKSKLEARLQSTIASLRSENTKALKRLNEITYKKDKNVEELRMKTTEYNEAVKTISIQADQNQEQEARIEKLKEEIRILKNRLGS